MAHIDASRYQIEEKNSFPNKTKHNVLCIKFQNYTTLVSFLIPNPYHFMNQTLPKGLDEGNYYPYHFEGNTTSFSLLSHQNTTISSLLQPHQLTIIFLSGSLNNTLKFHSNALNTYFYTVFYTFYFFSLFLPFPSPLFPILLSPP